MKSQQSRENLIWIDLEMTGLDPEKERIIEIATLVTDSQLNILAEGPNIIVSHPKSLPDGMKHCTQHQHGASALIDSATKCPVTWQMLAIDTPTLLSQYIGPYLTPLY